jgi:hypothetical protein
MEVHRTQPSPSVSVPWFNRSIFFLFSISKTYFFVKKYIGHFYSDGCKCKAQPVSDAIKLYGPNLKFSKID